MKRHKPSVTSLTNSVLQNKQKQKTLKRLGFCACINQHLYIVQREQVKYFNGSLDFKKFVAGVLNIMFLFYASLQHKHTGLNFSV